MAELKQSGYAPNNLHEIALAAPDIDTSVFLNLAAAIQSLVKRTTIYASRNDFALQAARAICGNYVGLGDIDPSITVVPGMDSVDASAVDTSLSGHQYYADNRSIVSDLFQLVRGSPAPRAGMCEMKVTHEPYYVIVP
jgi:esterase/lipase superfamily enzyme